MQQKQLIGTYVRGMKMMEEVYQEEPWNYCQLTDFARISQNVFCAQLPRAEPTTRQRLLKGVTFDVSRQAAKAHALCFCRGAAEFPPDVFWGGASYFKLLLDYPGVYQVAQAVTLMYELLQKDTAVLLIGDAGDATVGLVCCCFYAALANILHVPLRQQQIIATFNIRRQLKNKLVSNSICRYVNFFLQAEMCISDTHHIAYRLPCYGPLKFTGFRVSKPLPNLVLGLETTDCMLPILSTPVLFHEADLREFNNTIIAWQLESFLQQIIKEEELEDFQEPQPQTNHATLQWSLPHDQMPTQIKAKVYLKTSQPRQLQITLQNELTLKAMSNGKLVDSAQVCLGMWPAAGVRFTGLVQMDNGLEVQFIPERKLADLHRSDLD